MPAPDAFAAKLRRLVSSGSATGVRGADLEAWARFRLGGASAASVRPSGDGLLSYAVIKAAAQLEGFCWPGCEEDYREREQRRFLVRCLLLRLLADAGHEHGQGCDEDLDCLGFRVCRRRTLAEHEVYAEAELRAGGAHAS